MALLSGSWLYDFIALIVSISALIYAFYRHRFQHWQKRGFPYVEPKFPEGNFQGVNRTKGLDISLMQIYRDGEGHQIIGAYMMARPLLVIRDMDLAKNILIRDFSHFHDRGFRVSLKLNPLAGHLFLMSGQEWRNLRIKLTPTFTSGKMKMMFQTVVDVGEKLQTVLEDTTKKDEVEIKDILARFTTDVIASVAFGIEANSLENPNVEFRKMGNQLTHMSLWLQFINVLLYAAPWIAEYLPFRAIPADMSEFFIGITRDSMDYREKNNVQRNDFLQLLLQLKTLGYVKDADHPDVDKENQQKFTVEQAAAQAFLFFFAGFETSSSTMMFALYELALHPELQETVQKEIDSVLAKNDGKLTYEGVMGMELLARVVDETLRKYPVAGVMMRECNEKYVIPGTDLTVLPGDSVFFPIHAYHHDPQYYPDPEKFDPDRFLPENKASRPQCAYMPFGDGPRNCIGSRFGLMQTKIGLCAVLTKYTVTPSVHTPIPMVFDPKTNILTPKALMPLKVSRRN